MVVIGHNFKCTGAVPCASVIPQARPSTIPMPCARCPQARLSNIPKDILDRNIKKASNPNQEDFVEMVYEAYGPGGTGFILDCAAPSPLPPPLPCTLDVEAHPGHRIA